jgi:hypothetical protein
VESAYDGTRSNTNMASYPNEQFCEPSASAEGFAASGSSTTTGGPLHASPRTAFAHAELAALPGNRAVHTTPEHLTGGPGMPHFPAPVVGAPAISPRGETHG